jgi:hypothetical protein
MGKVIDISTRQDRDRAIISDEADAALKVFERELNRLVGSMVQLAIVYEARGVEEVASRLVFQLELARANAKEALQSGCGRELPLRIDLDLMRRLDAWRRAQPGSVSLSSAVSSALTEFLERVERP